MGDLLEGSDDTDEDVMKDSLREERIKDVSEKVATSHLDAGSLQLLVALLGKQWQFVTGEPLAERPGSLAAFDEVLVVLEGAAVAVKSIGPAESMNAGMRAPVEAVSKNRPRRTLRTPGAWKSNGAIASEPLSDARGFRGRDP